MEDMSIADMECKTALWNDPMVCIGGLEANNPVAW